jgi:hypothetical protein
MSRRSEDRNRLRTNSRINEHRSRSSIRLLYTVPLMIVGLFLVSSSTSLTNPGGFQDFLFGFGVLLWIVGVLGSVYAVVNRLAGPRAAKWAVVLLIFVLLSQVIFRGREKGEEDLDSKRSH